MSEPAIVTARSPSGNHVKVLCPCNREHWTGRGQDVMAHCCGAVIRPETDAEARAREAMKASEQPHKELLTRVFRARKDRKGMRLSAEDVARLARLFLEPTIDFQVMEDI